jgi:hypothetical protein
MRNHIRTSRSVSRAGRKDAKRKASQSHYENVFDAHQEGRITDHEANDHVGKPGHFGDTPDNSNKFWTSEEVHHRSGLNK